MPAGHGPAIAAPNPAALEHQRAVLNEKYKAQSSFFFNLSVAIVTAGPVASLIKASPSFDWPLIVLSCAFGAIFYLIGSNRIDQIVAP